MKFTILLVFVLGLYTVLVSSYDNDICAEADGYGRDPTDCRRWFKCSDGKDTPMKRCRDDMVYSLKALTCVPEDSEMNDCNICAEADGYERDPTDCRRWFKCSEGKATPMKRCRDDMVYSLKALTCVPEDSEMNDCNICAEVDGYGRDPTDCRRWFKCSDGKATPMKHCRDGMVYSLKALTCVPEDSEMNDCNICAEVDGYGRDPTDCRRWFKCSEGKATPMKRCRDDMVYSLKALTCVLADSEMNDCNEPVDEATPEEKCSHGIYFRSPKADNCAQFYNNCSSRTNGSQPEYLGEKVGECLYPQFFSAETKQCEDFEKVKCRGRKEVVYACDYKNLQCLTTECKPCSFNYPDCRGLPDGDNEWLGLEGTAKYARCYKGRGSSGECQKNYLFSPDTKRCEHEKDFVGIFNFNLKRR